MVQQSLISEGRCPVFISIDIGETVHDQSISVTDFFIQNFDVFRVIDDHGVADDVIVIVFAFVVIVAAEELKLVAFLQTRQCLCRCVCDLLVVIIAYACNISGFVIVVEYQDEVGFFAVEQYWHITCDRVLIVTFFQCFGMEVRYELPIE